jgi:ClpP class serine protease
MMPKESFLTTNGGSGETSPPSEAVPEAAPVVDVGSDVGAEPKAAEVAFKPWSAFLRTAKPPEIQQRLSGEIGAILARHQLDKYCALALFEPEGSIDSFDLDRIFSALSEQNSDHSKEVLLLLLSRGGSIEPAYQISKLCKSFAKQRFVALVPRHAKSAATLIAIGADEIHMGPLGQLGPIDPQLGGLPALGVSQALKTIASVA